MKKETRPTEHHPAIQNLRWFLRDYLSTDPRNTLANFASKLGKTANELGRYLRGEVTPRKKMIELWAAAFGVDYNYMMTADFTYINYPFERESSPKKSGGHITKKEVRQNFSDMYDEVSAFVGENDDFKYGKEILYIISQHKI